METIVEEKHGLAIRENFIHKLRNKNGTLTLRNRVKNIVLNDGLDITADVLGGTGAQGSLIQMAIGTSTAAPVATQTDLQGSELARVATTESRPALGLERWVGTFAAGVGTGTIEEMVLADTDAAPASRKCLTRVLTGQVVKGAGDSWTGTYELTVTRT